jgi:phosphonate transport system substrate-binding protein
MPDQPPNAGNPPATDKKPNGSPVAGLVVPGLLILAAGAVFAVFYLLNQKQPPIDPHAQLLGFVVAAEKYATLDAARYKDENKDLIADTPADAADPAELFFCEIPGPNPDKDEETWKAFLAHMEKATGKPCKYLKKVDVPAGPPEKRDGDRQGEEEAPPDGTLRTFEAQLDALDKGRLHVTAFTTGQVVRAVNTAGFRPLVVPADQAGRFTYQVKVLVPANSKAEKVSDLKGKKLAVTALSSNSGAKAPFVEFHEKFQLFPTRDYSLEKVGRTDAALAALVKGDVDATCIASDLLAREEAAGRASKDKYKVLYTFGEYPKLCFGVSHKLPDALVKKVQNGFETFPFDTNPAGQKYAAEGSVRFAPIDYLKDWEAVRQVDTKLAEIVKKR